MTYSPPPTYMCAISVAWPCLLLARSPPLSLSSPPSFLFSQRLGRVVSLTARKVCTDTLSQTQPHNTHTHPETANMGQFFSWLRGTSDSSPLEDITVEQQVTLTGYNVYEVWVRRAVHGGHVCGCVGVCVCMCEISGKCSIQRTCVCVFVFGWLKWKADFSYMY